MNNFKLKRLYNTSEQQEKSIQELYKRIKIDKNRHNVLLGATGTGKTFTVANLIEKVNKATIVMVHNKTLAGQLYEELKQYFPENRVEYFISNFDFYQPEAYMPKTDTYIDKNAVTNFEIEMLRSSAINSLIERKDTIVVASVAAIYGLSDPKEYTSLVFNLKQGEKIERRNFFDKLVEAQYARNDLDLLPGTFRARGDVIEISPASSQNFAIRVELFDDIIERITVIDPITRKTKESYNQFPIYPAYTHSSTRNRIKEAIPEIKKELEQRLEKLKKEQKLLEAQRLEQRTRHDIESLQEFGMCPGIENYSAHVDKRKKGETPYTLFDYIKDDCLLIIDESHVSLPQIKGMFNGDRSRKQTLVEHGFRLPSALDNRPLMFEEFEKKGDYIVYVSATPGDYELEKTKGKVVEQIIRPTGLLDPVVVVKEKENQIDDIIENIEKAKNKNSRVLITTLTISMAEDLTQFLKDKDYKVAYLHNETKTMERTQIIYELRKGKYDVLVGINLLREGLDIPEVSTILILDADKEGFLRSSRSLIQIIGRASRNKDGKVIMYADFVTPSMEKAISETERRRKIQIDYNKERGLEPKTIVKEIKEPFGTKIDGQKFYSKKLKKLDKSKQKDLLLDLEKEMNQAAKELDFERAAEIRDIVLEIKREISNSWQQLLT